MVRIASPAISLHLRVGVAAAPGRAHAAFYRKRPAQGRSLSALRYMHTCSCNNVCMGHGLEPDLTTLTAETARSVAETMHALADPSRVRILSRLAAGPARWASWRATS